MPRHEVFFIGGSPCSGKSTVAEMLVAKFGFAMYKCDDHLDRYITIGAARGSAVMTRLKSMSLDGIWLRDVDEQVREEFEFYRDASDIILDDLSRYDGDQPVVAEGAALTPELMRRLGTDPSRYICIVPTKTFQLEKYSRREWVSHYLSGCSDPVKAFENWMERDARFAEIVREKALQAGLSVIVVDGAQTVEKTFQTVMGLFGLDR